MNSDINTIDVKRELDVLSKGTHLIFDINKELARSLIGQIQTIFGGNNSRGFLSVGGYFVFVCSRKLPGLVTILRNDERFKVTQNEKGYFIISYR